MTEYKKHSPEKFYWWASQGRVMEIRFLSDYLGNKFRNYPLIKELADKFNCEYRYSSLYITSYKQLRGILLHKLSLTGKFWPLTRIYNIFMRMNPCRKVDVKSKRGLLYKSFYGGIAGCSHLQNGGFDIEHVGIREGNATEAMIEECLQGALHMTKILKLKDYYINVSGNGVHLWFRFYPAIELPLPSFSEFEDKVKYNLKEEPIRSFIKRYNRFIEKMDKVLKGYNPKLKIDDGAKDISRVLRPPGSWNVKAGKTARAVGTIYDSRSNLKKNCSTEENDNPINIYINKTFFAVKPLLSRDSKKVQEKHFLNNSHRYNHLNISESPLFKLLTSKLLPSTLSRNHYLEQSFALLLKENNIRPEQISNLIAKIDAVQNKNVQVDPDYLDDDLTFNSEMVNNYCIECGIDLVYPLLETVPVVTEDFISEEHYQRLNNYSWLTLKKMMIKEVFDRPMNYMKLKQLIRNLIDEGYSRSEIFFTLKNQYQKKWDYYDKNRIVLQLLNKTRKQK